MTKPRHAWRRSTALFRRISYSHEPLSVAGFVLSLTFVTPAADVILWAFTAWVLSRRRSWPPMWVWILPLALVNQAVYGAHAGATGLTMIRVFCLSMVAVDVLERWDGQKFAQGVLWGLGIHALTVLRGVQFETRMQGLSRYVTILSNAGYCAFAVYTAGGRSLAGKLPIRLPRALQFLAACVLTAASGARAPFLGIGAHDAMLAGQAIRRHREGPHGLLKVLRVIAPRLGLSVAVIATFLVFTALRGGLSRVSPEGMTQALAARVETVTQSQIRAVKPTAVATAAPAMAGESLSVAITRDPSLLEDVCRSLASTGRACGMGRLTWGGTGASAYLYAFEWPRPHSSYAILAYEWGLWGLLPLALLVWYVQRRPWTWPAVVGLLALGIFDDTPLSAPEGHYLIAIVLTSAAGLGIGRSHTVRDTARSVVNSA